MPFRDFNLPLIVGLFMTYLLSGAGIFVNRFSSDHANGSFYEHVSPTSFYALAAKAATDEQAATMATNWLMNASRFCVSATGGDGHVGLSDSCYWPLPSIEASDAAYPKLGYWRGYIWGPMAQLTYWSLESYDHVPEVRLARKSLCKQMGRLMMSQWTQHRHICENYNPHKGADTTGGDCSGTRFYHWYVKSKYTAVPVVLGLLVIDRVCVHCHESRLPAYASWAVSDLGCCNACVCRGALTGLIGLMEDGLF